MGMSTGGDTYTSGSDIFTIDVANLITDALVTAGTITSAEFSFACEGFTSSRQSYLDVGAPLASRVEGGLSSMVRLDLNYNSFFWSTEWKGINFGSNQNDNAYKFDEEIYTIFDTGSSHLFLPSSIFMPTVLEIMK